MYHDLRYRLQRLHRRTSHQRSIFIPPSIIGRRRRWYPPFLRHLRYDLARDDGGFLCDFLVCDGVALAAVMVRVAAGGDEEGEVEKSVGGR